MTDKIRQVPSSADFPDANDTVFATAGEFGAIG
jgi:hypothetical protein